MIKVCADGDFCHISTEIFQKSGFCRIKLGILSRVEQHYPVKSDWHKGGKIVIGDW